MLMDVHKQSNLCSLARTTRQGAEQVFFVFKQARNTRMNGNHRESRTQHSVNDEI